MGRIEDLERNFLQKMQNALASGQELTCSECKQLQNKKGGMEIIKGKPLCSSCQRQRNLKQEEVRRQEREHRNLDREDQAAVGRRIMTMLVVNELQEQGLRGRALLGQLSALCPSLRNGAEDILKLSEGGLDRDKITDELYKVFVTHGLMKPMKTRMYHG